MMASVSVVYEVFSILLLQCISCEADVQNNTVNMTTLECPVDVPAGYEIKGSLEYNTSLYFSCQGCNGQDTWGDSECKPNGTRDEVTLPNCTVSCLNSDKSCTSGMNEHCLFWPVTSWEKCGQSCDTPALCHRESGESDCQCGIYARHGRCEKEADIRDNVCPYTCSLRANITCGDPNILFPHAVASLQTTPHWMDSMSFKCQPGYMNMGPSSWVGCSINGTLTLKYNVHAPHCVPEKIYSMFRYTQKAIRLVITETFPAKSGFECAVACRERSSCIYFIFENNTCDICKLHKTTSGGINMSGKQLWQKVLPTQYSRDFATP